MNKLKIHGMEFNVAHNCNLKCDNCDHLAGFFSHSDPAVNAQISLNKFAEWVKVLEKSLVVEEFLLLGGEPLLNKEVYEYAKILQESPLATNVCMVTNGHLMPRQKPEQLQVFDKIFVSNYSSKPVNEKVQESIRKQCQEAGVELKITPVSQFHKPFVPKRHDSKLAEKIYFSCGMVWKQKCYVLYDGMVGKCSRIPFISRKLKEVGKIENEFVAEDCLKIEDTPDFAETMRQYFDSPETLESCHYCLGAVAKPLAHRQLTKEEIDRESWTEATTDNALYKWKMNRRWLKFKMMGRY